MIARWRRDWSAVPGTTSPSAPFGVVELAGGTSEGHGFNMPFFRRAQTADHGFMPNPLMPDVFFASAFDLPDPWACLPPGPPVPPSLPPSFAPCAGRAQI